MASEAVRGAELLRVNGAAEARAALDAARGIELSDARSVGWTVLNRGLWGAGATVSFLAVAGGPLMPSLLVGIGLGALATVAPAWWGRRCAAEPRATDWWMPGAIAATVMAVFAVLLLVWDQRWVLRVGLVAALSVGYALAPAVRWLRSRRPGGAPPHPWPPGSEAFAVLAALDGASWVDPERLSVVLGLPVDLTLASVEALRGVGSIARGSSVAWGWDEALTASPAGRTLFAEWTAELESLAPGVSRARPRRLRPAPR